MTKSLSSKRSRLLTYASACAVALTIVSCIVSGHAKGKAKFKAPYQPPVTVGFDIQVGEGGTVDVDAGKPNANKCVKITWTDSTGKEITPATIIQANGSGHGSGQVPAGAVRFEMTEVPCPEASGTSGNKFDFPSLAAIQNPIIPIDPVNPTRYMVLGGSVIPDSAFGSSSTQYYFLVEKYSGDVASKLVEPIVTGGIGSNIPSGVEVVAFTVQEVTNSGATITSGMQESFIDYTLDVNNGAFTADLASQTNVVTYRLNGWEVVEVQVPAKKFYPTGKPGTVTRNSGSIKFQTSGATDFTEMATEFEFTN